MKRYASFLLIPSALLVIFGIMFAPTLFDSETMKRVATDRPVSSPVFDGNGHDIVLLFFGYAGCADVCAPRLADIADIYRDVAGQKDVQVLFINLIPMLGEEAASSFARYFHEDFVGVSPDPETLKSLKATFDVYVAESLSQSGTYDHTAFLYLLKREDGGYRLRYIYTHTPLDETLIVRDITAL